MALCGALGYDVGEKHTAGSALKSSGKCMPLSFALGVSSASNAFALSLTLQSSISTCVEECYINRPSPLYVEKTKKNVQAYLSGLSFFEVFGPGTPTSIPLVGRATRNLREKKKKT